jgi:hypothetical protein
MGAMKKVPGIVAALLLATTAQAGGINHFEAAAGPHNYVVTNHPAVLPNLVPSAWMLVSYANDPLVFRDDNGKQIGDAIIANQINTEIAAALGLFDRFEVGVVAPAFFMNGAGFDGRGLTAFGTGDLRVLGKALLTPWNDGLVASVRLSSDIIPIAQLLNSDRAAAALSGDTLPNVTPAFTVGFNSEYFRAGLDAGFLLRFPQELAGDDLVAGSQITYGAGAEVAIVPKSLFLTADVNGRAAPAALGSDKNRFPLEGDLAIKYFAGPLLLMVGGGSGLIPDYGAPDFRVFGAIGWFDRPAPKEEPAPPPAERKDTDKDGLFDDEDECPTATSTTTAAPSPTTTATASPTSTTSASWSPRTRTSGRTKTAAPRTTTTVTASKTVPMSARTIPRSRTASRTRTAARTRRRRRSSSS